MSYDKRCGDEGERKGSQVLVQEVAALGIWSKGAVVGGCEHEARGAGNDLMGKYLSPPVET